MALAKKVCRVCGEPYEACRSAKKNATSFHWQEVACSPECGAEYLRRVMEARSLVVKAEPIIDVEVFDDDLVDEDETDWME